jgi:hypothetical protein
MAGVIADMDILDGDPANPPSADDRDGARARLSILADRKSELFTAEVVSAAVNLVDSVDGTFDLLDPLRRLSLARSEFAPDVARAAITALRQGNARWASRCIADLPEHTPRELVDESVCTALIQLAGAPAIDHYGLARPNATNDPTGLRAIADIAPDVLRLTLTKMLPPPSQRSALFVASPPPTPALTSTLDRAAAAGAVRALAESHPEVAAALVEVLILDLGVPPDDEFQDPAHSAIQRTLSAMLVLDVGDVAKALDTAGRKAGQELHGQLVRVMTHAVDMISADPKWREPGDPISTAVRRGEVAQHIRSFAFARLNGHYGDEVMTHSAELLKDLAELDPAAMLADLPSLLGSILALVDASRALPRPSSLTVRDEPPVMQFLDRMSREAAFGNAIRSLRDSLNIVAAHDVTKVCAAIIEVIADERDTDRGGDLVWFLLPAIGKLGYQHGGKQHVLRTLLPVLHSYLVDADPTLRTRAIDAWVEIGATNQLPPSLQDLLPALAADQNIFVARALARAAIRLTWTEDEKKTLLLHTLRLLNGVAPAEQPEAVEEATCAACILASDVGGDLRASVEQNCLSVAANLDGYRLKDCLRRTWLPATDRSAVMASLRLRQAADLRIRQHDRDDEAITALLSCGPGLVDLPYSELAEAAMNLVPDHPLSAAEFAEVASRASRRNDAATIVASALLATPDQPAYASRRLVLELVSAVADFDVAAASDQDWTAEAERVLQAASVFASGDGQVLRLAELAKTIVTIRALLSAQDVAGTPRLSGEPSSARKRRADALEEQGKALAAQSQHATNTGSYLQAFAEACIVGAHLLRADAAVLDADGDAIALHAAAARRRADTVARSLGDQFAPNDPLAAELRARLLEVGELEAGTPVEPVLAAWSRLSLPLAITTGPHRQRAGGRHERPTSQERNESDETAPIAIAVALASIDGQLVTGPEVLRPDRLYDLMFEIQTGPWPDWAERLDCELITHLTKAELTTPEFTWTRGEQAEDNETYTKSGPLVLRFALGPGQPAPPLLTRIAWRGKLGGQAKSQELDIAGHRQLRLRPFDPSRDHVTDYPVFDERLLKMYEKYVAAGYPAEELEAFCRLLTSICRIGLRMTWDKKYRRGTTVTERQFHDDLHQQLLADPELGGRVDRGNPLALGYLDVRHDGVTAELKVERTAPATPERAPKYMGQPTQYAAADGAHLSILAILDMSAKTLPIGTPENYLFELEPRLHGLENPEAPSLVAGLIINGNMPTPSSWSRRKTPTAEQASD